MIIKNHRHNWNSRAKSFNGSCPFRGHWPVRARCVLYYFHRLHCHPSYSVQLLLHGAFSRLGSLSFPSRGSGCWAACDPHFHSFLIWRIDLKHPKALFDFIAMISTFMGSPNSLTCQRTYWYTNDMIDMILIYQWYDTYVIIIIIWSCQRQKWRITHLPIPFLFTKLQGWVQKAFHGSVRRPWPEFQCQQKIYGKH